MRVVPHRPLLWLALFVFVPGMTVAVWASGPDGQGDVAAALAWLAMIALVVIAWVDALASRRRVAGLRCRCPETLRCTAGKRLEVPVTFSNEGEVAPWMRFAPALTRDFRAEGELVGRLPGVEKGQSRKTRIDLTPLRRGRHFLEEIHVEVPSRFRFWLLRRRFEPDIEVRVYPDLAADRRRLAGEFLLRGQDGTHVVRQVGKGRDFEQLRDYQPGDDYVDIDWKATARRQMPVTRTYQIERTQEIYVVVDHSRLSAREIRVPVEEEGGFAGERAESEEGSGGEFLVTTQLERFLHCALVLASVAEQQGDRFGFLGFADKVDRFIRSGSGKEHYHAVRDALYTLEPSPVAPDFEQLMIALRQRLTRRALLVMLVDLSDPLTAEHFRAALPLVSRQHLVLVNMVRPERAHPLFSGADVPGSTEEIYEALGGHFQWRDLQETGTQLGHLGVELCVPEHAELCTEAVTQYLNVKKRQLI